MASLVELKTKLCSEYLALSNQMQVTAQAMQAYVRGVAAAPSHQSTLKELAALPYLPIKTNGSDLTISDAYVDLDANKSKKRKADDEKPKKAKKEKDPNAPKRPASGFLLYQNSRRAAVKEENPTKPYKEQLAQISEEWKNLNPAEKEKFNAKSKKDMDAWKVNFAQYEVGKKAAEAAPTPVAADSEEVEDSEPEPPTSSKKVVAKPAASDSDSDSDDSDSESEEELPKKKKAKVASPPPSKEKSPSKRK